MTTVKNAARHRLNNRTITPLTDLTQTAQFGRISKRTAASATATGIALTAIAGAANAIPASPEPVADPSVDEFTTVLDETSVGTIVAIDQTWDPGDEVAAEAEEPAAVVEETEPQEDVASRSEERTEIAETEEADVSVPEVTVDNSSIVSAALSVTGIPYVYGGASLSGMDCSGLVSYVYAQMGISLPHQSEAIAAAGTAIPASEAQPGDVIWYYGHVAIYIGNGQMVEATTPGSLSTVSEVRGGYNSFIRF